MNSVSSCKVGRRRAQQPAWAGLMLSALLALSATPTQAADGAALFAQNCAACHQPDGSGTVGLAPALKGAHWGKLGAHRDYLPTVLLKGMAGSIVVNGVPFVGNMPSFASLDDDSLAALANHVRSLQGATGDYDAAQIATKRSEAGSSSQTRSLRIKVLATP